MRIAVTTHGLESVRDLMKSLSGRQLAEATSKALNDTGFQARRAMRAEFRRAFDRPTAYILSAPKVVPATPAKLAVVILPTNQVTATPGKGGKVGVDQQAILQAQELGGSRRDKKSEVVLRRAGILQAGYQTVIPATPFPGSDDGHGNLRGAFLQQLLSYLQLFGEQGYSANMKPRARSRLQRGREAPGPMQPGKVHRGKGRRYFVSYGRLRGNRSSHLAPGIWAAMGTHGADVRPVLMFVRTPSYQPRIAMDRVAQLADVENYLPRRLRFRIREAAGV